eukprot:4055325-Ditylum_brightwellii.AAC.1
MKITALKAFSITTKAAILWTIYLQARHFFWGEMMYLSKFEVMVNNLKAKQATITHVELPYALIPNTSKKGTSGTDTKMELPAEKQKQNWHPPGKAEVHPFLANKFQRVWKLHPKLTMLKLFHFCNTSISSVTKEANL